MNGSSKSFYFAKSTIDLQNLQRSWNFAYTKDCIFYDVLSFHDSRAASSPMSAIVFEYPPGPGYILIRPLLHGSEGEVYLVRSMQDGTKYVLKDSTRLLGSGGVLGLEMLSIEDRLSFDKIFPPNSNMVPTVKRYETRRSCLLYQYCNGGSLRDFLKEKIGAYRDPKRIEAIFWHIIKEICKILQFTIEGKIDGHEKPLNWDALANNDLNSMGQFLVHWVEGADSKFPAIMIGDWGFGEIHEKADQNEMSNLAKTEFDKFDFMLSLLKDTFYREDLGGDDFITEQSPFAIFRNVYKEALKVVQANDKDPKFRSIAGYIAQNFVPRAERRIKMLQQGKPLDMRLEDPIGRYEGLVEVSKGVWERQVIVGQQMKLEMLHQPPFKQKESIMLFRDADREAHLEKWSNETVWESPPGNQRRKLVTPWSWLAEADIPKVVLDGVVRSNSTNSDLRISRGY